LEAFDHIQQQLADCDMVIEAHIQSLAAHATPATTPLPAARPRQKRISSPHPVGPRPI
jgi:hypothetical protein